MRRLLVTVMKPIDESEFDKDNEIYTFDEELQEHFKEVEGYLQHWGMKFDAITDHQNNVVGVGNYTVAFVEIAETGRIEACPPDLITIKGYTTYR